MAGYYSAHAKDDPEKLRLLIKLIELKRRKPVYTDFEDEIGPADEIELPGITPGIDINRFRMKVQHFLKDYETHPTIQKSGVMISREG